MSFFAGLKLLRSYSVWALLVISVVVALLARQQYRWIGKVSEVEAKTSREKLADSLQRVADDFDTEVTRVYLLFMGVDGKDAAAVLEEARRRFLLFRRLSRYPELIQSIGDGGSWPAPSMFDPGPPPAFSIPAILTPVMKRKPGTLFVANATSLRVQAGGRIGFGVPLHIRVVLDWNYVKNVLLPEMLRRHLGQNANQHYDVLVSSHDDGRSIFRWGSPNAAWDSEVRMFAVRPDCLVKEAKLASTIAVNETKVITAGRLTRSLTSQGEDPASLFVLQANCEDPPRAESGMWLLRVQARPSLQETIDSARRQSLAASFGVMLVLGLAIMVLFVSGHRARELAARHEQFAAGVSHELRTPLSVISSASSNLADGVIEQPDQVRQYGNMIHAHAQHLSAMVENALWFARRDVRATLKTERIDPEELIRISAASCSRLLANAEITLEIDLAPGLPAFRGNRTLLLQALENLITNAATHGGSGRWARVRATPERDTILFTVEDRGPGIPPEEAKRVFEPFYRGKNTRQTTQAGLGLGLTLVRRIVEAHGGTVELGSRAGGGTTIAFALSLEHA
jgi:signal transduction histidine kinase